METNPYAPGEAESEAAQHEATWQDAIAELDRSRGLIYAIAALAAFFGGIMLLAATGVALMGMLSEASIPPYFASVYVIMAASVGLPTAYLFRYAIRIGRAKAQIDAPSLLEAHRAQKHFWVSCLIGLVGGFFLNTIVMTITVFLTKPGG